MSTEDIAALEARLRRFEDIEEIRRLKVRYFEACDGGFGGMRSHVPGDVASVFADDGVWEGESMGRLVGPAAIQAFYEKVPQMLAYTMLSEPVIDVDGDRATGRWNILVYSSSEKLGSNLTGGVHHDEYVRTPNGWRIAHTSFVSAISSTSPVPWVRPSAPDANAPPRPGLLDDERGILQTLYQYGHSMDYGPDADFVDCFAPDGVWDVQMRKAPEGSFTCRGHAAIQASLGYQTSIRAPVLYAKHLMVEPRIEITGDEARVLSYFLRVEPQDAGPSQIVASGRYVDDLVRCADGRWRFRLRVCEIDDL